TLNLNGGTFNAPAGAPFGNAGTVNLTAQALVLDGGDGGLGGGAYNIGAGAGLDLAAGSYGIGSLTGGGVFGISGGTANLNNASFTGTGVLGGGSLNIFGAASFATLAQTGGVLTGSGGDLAVASYQLNNPSGTGTIGGAFNNLSLTSPGDLTIRNSNLSAAGNLALDTTTGRLWIDGSSVSGGNVSLGGAWLLLSSSGTAASQVNANGNLSVNTALLELNGATGAAKLGALGTMTINATTVDVLAGAASASIDPTTLTLIATGNLTLAGGSAANASATLLGGAVDVSAGNVSLTGGSGANAYAGISATSGNLTLNAGGNLSLASAAGTAPAGAVLTAAGSVQVAALTCAGCIELASDPLLSPTVTDVGAWGGSGVNFAVRTPTASDPSVAQAIVMAASNGTGTSNVSNEPQGSDTNGGDDASDNRNKKLPTCK
ncbi:MAG: hypothetical protein OEW21_18350, partial [Betaproteobacteria bacterium]|nr:hypothetical protein [Betaproteobacteria bacterium]